jgi:VWFA-related protein
MKRRLAALVACALMAFGQRSSPLPAAAPVSLVIDAVAVDASGRAVADLTADDFEVVQGGSARKIANFTWFDTRLHTAVSPAGQLPALDLLPDEIRRNLVVVVDDLGLTPAGIDGVRDTLKAFVAGGMSSGDRMAILRTSGGSGALGQLTGDTRTLVNAIQGIGYLGGGNGAASACKASWLTLRYALDGLRDFRGRKVVVLFAENPEVTGPSNRGVEDAAYAAHAAGAAVYALHPLHPLPETPGGSAVAPSAMESFTRDTGGWFGGDFAGVLRNEQGYYAIGFLPEDDTIDSTGRRAQVAPAVVKVRRPGVVVRARAGYIRLPPRVESLAPAEYAVLFNTALRSPFGGSDIPTRLTALFSDYPGQGPEVEAVVQFEPRDLTFVHDLQDVYHGAVRFRLAAYRDDGLTTVPLEREFKFTMRPAEYRNGIEYGLHFPFQVRLPGPGVWQIRAVVADGGSDRMGSATQFVEIPNVGQGGLALTGLMLSGGLMTAESAAGNSQEEAGVRIFKPGQNCTFRYGIFNALTGTDKQSTLEVVTRIFVGGHVVFETKQGRVTYSGMPAGSRRMIRGELRLDARMVPGDFVLQVTVRDTLAPPGQVRTATVFTDFQIRE